MTASAIYSSPISLSLFSPSYSLRHSNIEIRPIINSTMTYKCSRERKSCMPLTLNQKLKIINLSEEGMLKAEIGQKLELLHQIFSQVVNAKETFLKNIKSAIAVNTQIIKEQNSLIADMESFTCLDRRSN